MTTRLVVVEVFTVAVSFSTFSGGGLKIVVVVVVVGTTTAVVVGRRRSSTSSAAGAPATVVVVTPGRVVVVTPVRVVVVTPGERRRSRRGHTTDHGGARRTRHGRCRRGCRRRAGIRRGCRRRSHIRRDHGARLVSRACCATRTRTVQPGGRPVRPGDPAGGRAPAGGGTLGQRDATATGAPTTVTAAAANPADTDAPPVPDRVTASRAPGICANQDSGPPARCRRPTETPRSTRTTSGSNCVPLLRVSSSHARQATPSCTSGRTSCSGPRPPRQRCARRA